MSYRGGLFVHIGGLRSDDEPSREYEQYLYRYVSEQKKEAQVIWLGKRADVSDILPAFDIYVHPSSSEGLPVSLMEAAAAGLPLIGTRVGGIPEIIENLETGILVDYGDWTTLHSAMEQLRKDVNLRKQFGGAARRKVLNQFEVNTQIRKLINEYFTNR